MRYIVYGAGAIGGVIGGRLAFAGRDVVLIARGDHLRALRERGLRLITPSGELSPPVEVTSSPVDAAPEPGDVVILAVKSQDTDAAVAELDRVPGGAFAVVSAQNGVANERYIARRGFRTYGQCVNLGATHLEPGVVTQHFPGIAGILDLGVYPKGVDPTAEAIAADLCDAGFASIARPDIMRWKYAKLLGNLGNALDATVGREGRRSELYRRARDEAESVYRAAEIGYASEEETVERRSVLSPPSDLRSSGHQGSSSWQSIVRGTGSIEADWLNGEIVLLGREHGIATPVNEVLRRAANELARSGSAPRSLSVGDLESRVAALEESAA